MSLEISLVRGPLPDDQLDAITETYGTVDRRYATREFCRTVFNDNPSGFSYHAFVRDRGRVVGHYAVVPIRARARGTTVISGKGEALFLAESSRRDTVATPQGEVPAGIALMKAVHELALSDGIAVIHNITSPEIGVIERMLGFRMLTVWLDQLHFLLAPSQRPLKRRSYRVLGARLLSASQRLSLSAARVALRLAAAPDVEVDPPAYVERHLSALATSDPGSTATWTISRDLETVRWLKRLRGLEVVSVRGQPDHFAIMSTGNSRELLLWNVPAGAIRSGVAIVCALLSRSVQDRALTLSMTRRLAAAAGPSLGFALRILAFLPRRVPMVLYAKSADPFYVQSTNVEFSRMFHL